MISKSDVSDGTLPYDFLSVLSLWEEVCFDKSHKLGLNEASTFVFSFNASQYLINIEARMLVVFVKQLKINIVYMRPFMFFSQTILPLRTLRARIE